MEIRQCDFCRMPYQSLGNKICKDCLTKLDEDFIKIKEYLYENDGAGIEEVVEATGITKKAIMHLLKEERLIVGSDTGDIGAILKCESCKKPIRTGKMCADCKKEVMTVIQQNVSAVPLPKKKKEEDKEEVSIKGAAKLQLK